jgi:hypothetical protein
VAVNFWQFFKNYRRRANFWTTFTRHTSDEFILATMGWATFWATFSQTHLVALVDRPNFAPAVSFEYFTKTFLPN